MVAGKINTPCLAARLHLKRNLRGLRSSHDEHFLEACVMLSSETKSLKGFVIGCSKGVDCPCGLGTNASDFSELLYWRAKYSLK